MRAWVDWCAGRRGADGTWSGDWHFGDWLDPGAPPEEPQKATTSSDYLATAYLTHSAGRGRRRRPARRRRAGRLLRGAAGPDGRRRLAHLGRPRADHPGRRRGRPAARHRPGRAAPAYRQRAGRAGPGQWRPDRHRFPRYPPGASRAHRRRPYRGGLPAPAEHGEPRLAVSGAAGSDDHVGTVGRHPPGRQHPHRGDGHRLRGNALVQPLRIRRRRRLALPSVAVRPGSQRPGLRNRHRGACARGRSPPRPPRSRPRTGPPRRRGGWPPRR